ncbi:hypothetical protein ACLKA6_010475 [Drosophila palustris]
MSVTNWLLNWYVIAINGAAGNNFTSEVGPRGSIIFESPLLSAIEAIADLARTLNLKSKDGEEFLWPRLLATIHGLPASLSTDWVAAKITALGYTPLSLSNVIGNITSQPTNNFRVELQFQDNNHEFLKLRSIGSFKVTIEKMYRRKKLIVQCYKCQRYGHTLRDCTAAEPTCLKCAGQHASRNCTIADQEARSCINCKGDHPASWDRCPTYLDELQTRGLNRRSSRAKAAIQAVGLQTSQSLKGSLTQRLLFSNSPPAAQVMPPAAQVMPPAAQVMPPAAQVLPPAAQVLPPAAQVLPPAAQAQPPAAQAQPPAAQDKPSAAEVQPPVDQDEPLAAYDSDMEEDFDEEDTDDFCDLVPLI